jgi:hypothetical protein
VYVCIASYFRTLPGNVISIVCIVGMLGQCAVSDCIDSKGQLGAAGVSARVYVGTAHCSEVQGCQPLLATWQSRLNDHAHVGTTKQRLAHRC